MYSRTRAAKSTEGCATDAGRFCEEAQKNPDLRQALSVANLSKTGIRSRHLARRAEAFAAA
jgi:hypothetical protein